MIEFSIVLIVDRKLCGGNGECLRHHLLNNRIVRVHSEDSKSSRNLEMGGIPLPQSKYRTPSEIIDLIALFVFMISHFIYNCIYFAPFS